MPNRYDTDYEIGQDNLRTWGMDIHNPVFIISAALVLLFVIGTIMFPEAAKESFDGSKSWSINNFDWFFLIAGNIFVIFCLILIVLPVGKIRLGGVDAKPEFSTASWFALLFVSGFGSIFSFGFSTFPMESVGRLVFVFAQIASKYFFKCCSSVGPHAPGFSPENVGSILMCL